jgi:tRNA U34 5-carboxymethylaminomethyl modifying enzyme MnmG/GidA
MLRVRLSLSAVSVLLAAAAVLLGSAAVSRPAHAATAQSLEVTTMKVAVMDMTADAPEAVSAKAGELSRDGIVLVFEGVESGRVTEISRVAVSNAIAGGYVVKAVILARQTAASRALVYGIDGVPYGPAIAGSASFEQELYDRVAELGKLRAGSGPVTSATSLQVAEAQVKPSAKRICRKQTETGSRVRSKTVCINEQDRRNQRDFLQNTQDRGVPVGERGG